MDAKVTTGRRARRRAGWAAALWLWAWPSASHAQQVVDFWSDPSWGVSDANNQPVGSAMVVCLTAIVANACPPGATSWQWPAPDVYPAYPDIPNARWIWAPGTTPSSPSNLATYTFTRTLTLAGAPLAGTIFMTADDRVEVRVNGVLAGAVGSVQVADRWPLQSFDILPLLVPGQNTIAVTAQNGPTSFGLGQDSYSNNPAGVVFGGRITVGVAGAPGVPIAFNATASGRSARFSWGPPTTGGTPTEYRLHARLLPGGPVAGSVSVGTALSLTVDLIAPGVYYVSVQGYNANGPGAESPVVAVTVPAPTQLPGAPIALASTVSGSTLILSWDLPRSGGLPSSYLVEAGTQPWFTTAIGTASVAAPLTSLIVPAVPAGVYYVRVTALNGAGRGAASTEVTVEVGGAAVPATPTFTSVQVVGRTVTAQWVEGAGTRPTHYLLAASTSADGPLSAPVSVTGTSVVAANVPSGVYYLQLRAVSAAGASSPSPPLLVVVP